MGIAAGSRLLRRATKLTIVFETLLISILNHTNIQRVVTKLAEFHRGSVCLSVYITAAEIFMQLFSIVEGTTTMQVTLHVIHAKYLANRRSLFAPLIAKLQESQLLGSVVMHEECDPNELTAEHTKAFTSNPLPDNDSHAYFNSAIQPLAVTQVSNVLKHKSALSSIASATDKQQLHMVIEDDVLYGTDVANQIIQAMHLYKPGTILFLGVPSPPCANPPEERNITDFYKVLPCCDSYLLDSKTAAGILPIYNAIRFPHHVQLTFAALKTQVALKCIAPHVFIDGSKYGVVTSNVEINNRLALNPKYNEMSQAIAALAVSGAVRNQNIDEMFKAFDFKLNPETYYLKARYETKLGNYAFARALYAYAYKLYCNNGTPLTRGSEFMQEYMKIHKHFQRV